MTMTDDFNHAQSPECSAAEVSIFKEAADAGLWYALTQLATRYWYDVDFNGGRAVHELYTSESLFVVGANRFEGRERIKSFYEWRRRRSTTTRHVISNAIVLAANAGRARMLSTLSVYRANGLPPFANANTPVLIADVTADCALGDDAVWRYTSHIVKPVFVQGDLPLSLAVDPSYLSDTQSKGGA